MSTPRQRQSHTPRHKKGDEACDGPLAHMAVTNNGKFMHCLPVRRGLIVTDEVIESANSIVIPEAANREISASVVLKRMLQAL